MTLVCKSGTIGNAISYIVTQNKDRQFDITLTVDKTEYTNKTASPKSADRWIEQKINILQGEQRE